MDVLRTPDDRFENLPGYPFQPQYVDVDDTDGGKLRIHYVDEGPRTGEPVLLLHGEPSWSYLYRKMVPPLAASGLRAIAPDLPGFGRSDKPAKRTDYTYARLVDWMWSFVEALELEKITMVGQDWGGLVGLRMVAEHPDQFARAVVANTGLPTGDQRMSKAFVDWQRFSQDAPEFPVGAIISGACVTDVPPDVVAAYDAPFPDESYKEGARALPALVPTAPDDPAAEANKRAWESLARFDKPFLCAFSDSDPITRGGDKPFREIVPGAKAARHTTIAGAGHFLQEDAGEQLAQIVIDLVTA